MNKIYRTVYNETTNTWVAVAEISTAKGKSNSRDVVATAVESAESSIFRFSPRSLLMAIVGAFTLLTGQAYAANGATITTAGSGTTQNAPIIVSTGITSTDVTTGSGGATLTAYNFGAMLNDTNNPSNPAQTGAVSGTWNTRPAYGLVVGNNATANNFAGLAFGGAATATGGGATALGGWSNATGPSSVAIGLAALAKGNGSLAMMRQSAATGAQSMAIGSSAQATVNGAIAVGQSAAATGVQSLAIGTSDTGAAGNNTYDGTTNTKASGLKSIALGAGANAGAEKAIAIGAGAQATATQSISVGVGNVVSGANSGAFGDPSYVSGTGTYTLGNDNGTAAAPIAANNAGAFGNNNAMTAAASGSRIVGNSNNVQSEPPRVSRRPNFLREYPNEKYLLT